MSTRLSSGGSLVDRSKPISFSFNGEMLSAIRKVAGLVGLHRGLDTVLDL